MAEKKFVYTIHATPSRNNHVAHIVAYCSSYEIAAKAIGNGKSYDADDDCHWTFIVGVVDAATLSKSQLSSLDEIPKRFPYDW